MPLIIQLFNVRIFSKTLKSSPKVKAHLKRDPYPVSHARSLKLAPHMREPFRESHIKRLPENPGRSKPHCSYARGLLGSDSKARHGHGLRREYSVFLSVHRCRISRIRSLSRSEETYSTAERGVTVWRASNFLFIILEMFPFASLLSYSSECSRFYINFTLGYFQFPVCRERCGENGARRAPAQEHKQGYGAPGSAGGGRKGGARNEEKLAVLFFFVCRPRMCRRPLRDPFPDVCIHRGRNF